MSELGGVSTGVSSDANDLKSALAHLKPVHRDKTAPYPYTENRERLIAQEKSEKKLLADVWIKHCDVNGQQLIDDKKLTALASDPSIELYGLDSTKLINDPPKSKDDFTNWALEERWVRGTDLNRVPKNESWEEHLEKRTARLKELKTEKT